MYISRVAKEDADRLDLLNKKLQYHWLHWYYIMFQQVHGNWHTVWCEVRQVVPFIQAISVAVLHQDRSLWRVKLMDILSVWPRGNFVVMGWDSFLIFRVFCLGFDERLKELREMVPNSAKDGCIVCPSTDSTFELRNGSIKEWFPKKPILRALTPALRNLFVYPVKIDGENIYISLGGSAPSDASAEIVFSGMSRLGMTATNVNVDEVRMVVIEVGSGGFGFTRSNELINGKAAIIGFLLLLDFELLTGKGLLKGIGFLGFLYSATNTFS
ncbi:putative rieske [2Fe-2S] iron-sulfur domain superfamily protein [Helianthus annuus]|nr:putative rieske [2Fe-2S] iron-sulfur domain superfamily protein [Helianthus annuus]